MRHLASRRCTMGFPDYEDYATLSSRRSVLRLYRLSSTGGSRFFANNSSAFDLISSAAKIGFEQLRSEQTKAAALSSGGNSTSACGNGPSRSSHHSMRLYPDGIRTVARNRDCAEGSSLCPTTVR